MNMVLYTTNLIEEAFFVFQNSRNIFKQFDPAFFGKGFFTVLSTKNNLIGYLCVCAHKGLFFSFFPPCFTQRSLCLTTLRFLVTLAFYAGLLMFDHFVVCFFGTTAFHTVLLGFDHFVV